MRLEQMEELARQALAESQRTDCELISVAAKDGAEHSWSIDLLDVMQQQEPFRVTLEAAPASTPEEIKEAIRRGIAEHFSATSY
jgi:DNA-binding transcriptional LysR family regulator